jgi:uncharacterized damage-inducible protein DinB
MNSVNRSCGATVARHARRGAYPHFILVQSLSSRRIPGRGHSMKTHFVMMANYNAWANARLFRVAAELADELYRKEVGAYFKSLHGTLNHLLVADRIWMRRLTGLGDHPDKLNAIIFDDLLSLHAARVEQDSRIIGFVQSLAEPAFEEALDYRMLNGAPQRQPRREILAHLFNHQTHHRGQAHVILTVLGVTEPDPLDLLIMQREQA